MPFSVFVFAFFCKISKMIKISRIRKIRKISRINYHKKVKKSSVLHVYISDVVLIKISLI